MRRALGVLASVLLVVALAAVAGLVWGRSQLRGSLPQIDGEQQIRGLAAPVRVTRDALGIPTVFATSRNDAARATGFLHAQDRFFQMDLRPVSWRRWSALEPCRSTAKSASIGFAPKRSGRCR